MADGLIAAIIVCLAIAVMFKPFWAILGFLILKSFQVLKWLIIIGLVAALANSKQVYNWLGVTPASLIFGDKFYKDINTREDSKHEEDKGGATLTQQESLPNRKHRGVAKRPVVTGR